MKNITIITPFFYPEPISTGKFNTEMVLALKEKGCFITVFCFHPFYPEWKIEKSDKELDGIKIFRGGKHIRFTKSATIRRIILELSFTFFILRNLLKIKRNTDILIPVFPPSLAFYTLRYFLKKKTQCVGIVHDLQEIYANQKKGILNKIIAKGIHHVEKKTYQYCDKLIFLSNEMKEVAQTTYQLIPSKLKVQYPFITINKKHTTNDLETLLPNNRQHIVYSGALGEKQNPKELLEVFEYCSDTLDGVLFHIFSQGTFFEELKEKNTNKNIQFHKLVPKKNIEELYNKSTIQIVPQLKGTSKGSLPSKLPNLLASGCNVLCITDKGSEIEKLFKEYEIETVVTTWDKKNIKELFEKILKKETTNEKQITVSEQLFKIEYMVDTIIKP